MFVGFMSIIPIPNSLHSAAGQIIHYFEGLAGPMLLAHVGKSNTEFPDFYDFAYALIWNSKVDAGLHTLYICLLRHAAVAKIVIWF